MEPEDQPALHCTGIRGYAYCSIGESYSVDCENAYGAKIAANGDFNVAYTTGAFLSGSGDMQKTCSPNSDFGGGIGDGSACETYVVEESDDGGNTWYEIGRYTDCQ